MTKTKTKTTDADSHLAQLAADINREHEAAEGGMRQSLLHAKAAGDKLIEVKQKVGHGNWMKWREENCSFSHSTARLYMDVAYNWTWFLPNSQPVENLTLHKAAEMLAHARRTALAEEMKEVSWGQGLRATELIESQNRLRSEVSRFWERLDGGRLYEDMRFVLKDSRPDDYQLVNIIQSFNELRHRVDRCIEALRRRMDDTSVTWEKPTQTVFSVPE